MLICTGDKSYKCSETKHKSADNIRKIQFSILEHLSPTEVKEIFKDNKFYFYDDVLGGRLIDTNGKKLVGLCITYNADSTCNITIKLTKRSC